MPGLVQKGAGLLEGVAQIPVAPIERDEIEQVAMLAGGGIGLMCNCT